MEPALIAPSNIQHCNRDKGQAWVWAELLENRSQAWSCVETPLLSTLKCGESRRRQLVLQQSCCSLAQGRGDVDKAGKGIKEAPGLEVELSAPLCCWGWGSHSWEMTKHSPRPGVSLSSPGSWFELTVPHKWRHRTMAETL